MPMIDGMRTLRPPHIAVGAISYTRRIDGDTSGAKLTTADNAVAGRAIVVDDAAAIRDQLGARIAAAIRTRGHKGVEMEAPTGVRVVALTPFDGLKAVDRSMVIEDIRGGGRSRARKANAA